MASLAETPIDPRRAPALAGGRNFRDLGGYETADGRHVRWGQVYRSGSLAGVTAEGVELLKGLGLVGVCDLRSTHERTHEPYHWATELGLSMWSRDYETSFGELRALMSMGQGTAAATKEAMLAGYRRLPFEQATAYGELFRRLAAGELPLVFNCSAGKDRAGTAAALVLTALGVPRETVAQDYALTDRVVDLEAVLANRAADPNSILGRQPRDVVRAILGCDPDYIRTALDLVAPDEATFRAYLNDTLGVDAAMLATIRERLLE